MKRNEGQLKNSARPPFRFSMRSRTEKEQSFMRQLELCFDNSPYSTYEKLMNFPLYVPRQDLTKFIVKYEIFKRVLNVHGSIVECGVCFGGGLLSWAQLSAIFEPTNHQRKVIGFDTFAGFPPLSEKDAKSTSEEAHPGGLTLDSYGEISRCISLYDMNRFVDHIGKVELIKGDATQTIPAYVKDNPHLLVSLLYLDFDLFEPTKVALAHLLPRMPKGAVVAFDELNLKDWPGETLALLETMDTRRLRIERFPYHSTISFAQIE